MLLRSNRAAANQLSDESKSFKKQTNTTVISTLWVDPVATAFRAPGTV